VNSRKPQDQTRADVVRQRRDTRKNSTGLKKANMVRYASETPPVIMRGNIGTPVIERTHTKPRRRVSIPLKKVGAELNIPSLPIFNPGWRLLSGILAFVLVIATGYYVFSNQFRIDTLDIIDIQRVHASDIEAILRLKNKPIFAIEPKALAMEIEDKFPELTDVKIQVNLPAKVSITANEREPIIAWRYGDNTVWVDREGFIFRVRGEDIPSLLQVQAESSPPLMLRGDHSLEEEDDPESNAAAELLSDNPIGRQVQPDILDAALTLANMFPSGISLTYNYRDGLGWQDPEGWFVFIGSSLEDMDLKLTIYQAITNALKEKNIKPYMISVEHIDAPFYRMEP
jgi:cell division protein FtsQ